MHKYFIIFTQKFSQFSVYRGHIVSSVFSSIITPALMLVALSSAKSTSGLIITSLLPYYLFISQTNAIIKSSVDEKITELNRLGDVNNFLTKPLSFFRFILASDIAEKVARFIYIGPVLAILAVLLNTYLSNQAQSTSSIFLFITGLPFSYFLSFILAYLAGLVSFWIDEAWAISNVRFVLIQLFGGIILPYDLFPDSLNQLLSFTPFPYVISFPTRLLQGKADLSEFVLAAFWCLSLYALTRIIEKKAILKYSFVAS